MKQDKYLVSDIYHVTLMINEYMITPAPREYIVEYAIKRGEQYNRSYLKADVIKCIDEMSRKKLLRKNDNGYEVN